MTDVYRVVRQPSGAALLARAGALLERAEAENNLLLSVAAALGDRPLPGAEAPFLATLEREGEAVAAALWTPPFRLTVSRAPEAALGALVEAVRAAGLAPPGVLAEEATARAFARAWDGEGGGASRVVTRMCVYELTAVTPARPIAGRFRHAETGDTGLLAGWVRAFAGDTRLDVVSEADALRTAKSGIERGAFFVWDAGAVVSMAAATGFTTGGARLNQVYTPPEGRGRGHASACVAALSQRLLDEGRRFVMLFADRDNPTSNHVYQAIGYRGVADFLVIDVG